MKTYSAKPAEIDKKWLLIDADGLVLGRLAVDHRRPAARQAQAELHAAYGLRRPYRRRQCREGGAHRQQAARQRLLLVTGFPGGIKERSKGAILEGKHPERVIQKAVERMVPRGPLGRRIMGHLKVYKGPTHPHEAQQPQPLDVAAMNRKNKRA